MDAQSMRVRPGVGVRDLEVLDRSGFERRVKGVRPIPFDDVVDLNSVKLGGPLPAVLRNRWEGWCRR